jgi:hypothetical protein
MRTSNDTGDGGFDDREYTARGFTAEQAGAWRRWRIGPDLAADWRAAGVTEALQAAQWTVAGVRPPTVGQWQAQGIDSGEAVHWHELGFSLTDAVKARQQGHDPHRAHHLRVGAPAASGWMALPGPGTHEVLRRFRDAGVRPEILHSYLITHWLDEQALAWARQDISAPDAKLWALLNLSPAESGRLARAGRTPDELVREWWRAGIPYDEVAAWLGAGLSAPEAAAQRAQGITAEQAATLRALREGEDLDD